MAGTSDATQQANRSGLDPQRLVVIFSICLAIVLTLFLEHILAPIFAAVGIPDRPLLEGLTEWRTSTLIAVVLSVGGLLVAWLHLPTRQLALDTAAELMRVTWPSFAETRISTVAVVIASVVAGLLLFFIDTLAYRLMVEWLPAFWGKL